jgi:hypothetical protein
MSYCIRIAAGCCGLYFVNLRKIFIDRSGLPTTHAARYSVCESVITRDRRALKFGALEANNSTGLESTWRSIRETTA